MSEYNPTDWYWIVGGTGNKLDTPDGEFTGDETRRFSSAAKAYVPATDATYLAWQAAQIEDRGYDPTTRIDTEANLAAVLAPWGITPSFAAAT